MSQVKHRDETLSDHSKSRMLTSVSFICSWLYDLILKLEIYS